MSTNYSEQIFQAVDTIVSQRLNEVSFDKTEICKIVSKDTSTEGKYWVTNDVLRFEAYSTDPGKSYTEGQKVYITIPSGDYSMRKIIIGSYSSDEIPKNLYTNPFDHLIASSEISIPTSNLKVTAKKDGTETIKSVTKTGLTFHYSGLGQFNYIGLDFSATTGFGGTIGEFQIVIDLLNSSGTSLLTNEQKGLLTFSSRQLYGNPYYLTSALHFQHLFNFPLEYNNVKFSDLTKVKQIKVTLRSLGNFNYPNTATTTDININSLKLYFGFDSTEDSMSENTVALVLDNPVNDLEYSTATDEKQMSIDWRNLTTNAIYNETDNKQYPVSGEYYVYWLQYSESIGYTKTLETSASDMSKIDIDESGTYWKTVQKKDANQVSAYSYTLKPCADWKKEQIKVIIKHKNGDYIESKGLTFTNKNFRSETGSNQGSKDTLRLSLAEGDDGVYNSYGIDNKLLTSYNLEHSLTVDYIDNTEWNKDLQKVIWKIPKNATMIKQPDGWSTQGNFYVLEVNHDTSPTDGGKTIKFKLSDQFSYNKTNNTIYCEIIRYKDKNSGIKTDEYQGSITLQFGLQGTNGTGWAFNIISNKRSITSGSGKDTMILTTTLENSNGDSITSDDWKANVEWSWHQTDGTNTPTLSPNQDKYSATITRKSKDDYYAIVKAVLKNWQDKNGNKINLTAYCPIATGDASYYLTGAARVIYNNQGTTPSYDTAAYELYNSFHTLVNKNYNYNIISPEANKNNCFTINSKEGNLKPLSFLPTIIPKMAIQISDTKGNVKYTQPILILKNGYQSTLINEWDGSLKIDSNNNTILSSLIGAGKKDSNNLFTGVILGVANNFKLGARTGLYGYQSGEVRFSLDEKGAFYVGQGSDNFISFNEGIAGRSSASELMIKTNKFDLNTPKLQINSSNGIKLLDTDGNIKVELKNDGTATIGGWNIIKNEIYSNTEREVDGVEYPFSTFMQNASTGTNAFGIYYTKKVDGKDKHIYPFRITHEGKLYASGAEIDGKFTISADSTLNGKTVSDINKSVFETLPDNINAKVSETKDGVTNGTGWSLKSDKFEIYSIKNKTSTTVLTVNKDGMNLRGTLDIDNGATINGKVQPGNLNVAGIISAGSADIQGIVKATEISASKITTGTLNANLISGTNSNTVTFDGNVTIKGNAVFYGKISSGTTIGEQSSTLNTWSTGCSLLTSNSGGIRLWKSGFQINIANSVDYPWIYADTDSFNLYGQDYGYLRDRWQFDYLKGGSIYSNGSIVISSDWDNASNQDKLALSTGTIDAGTAPLKIYTYNHWQGTASTSDDPDGGIGNNKQSIYIYAGENITLHAGSSSNTDKYVYVGNGKGNNKRIATDSSGPSSLNLKENIIEFNIEEFNESLKLLKEIKVYNYNYKFNDIHPKTNQFGFIIDELINNPIANKYFYFIDETAGITKANNLDYSSLSEGNPYNLPIINFKRYDEETLVKYLLVCCKALQQKIEELKQEIKEIKQNEI